MRNVVFVAIILFSFLNLKGQEGKFCLEDFAIGYTISIYKDSTFTYVQNGCVAQIYGEGKYYMTSDSLILNYKNFYNANPTFVESNNNEIILLISAIDKKSRKKLKKIELFELDERSGIVKPTQTSKIKGKHTYKSDFHRPHGYLISSPNHSGESIYIDKPGIYEIEFVLHDDKQIEKYFMHGKKAFK
ncbi:MAG: hypothetical protein KDC49_18925 [Saprospiraceae bacterium]|nr:hypothetical protein [Saprospiraceae bacterium]